MKVNTPFGEMLRLWRAAHGWSLRELATVTGVSYATLSRIERGHPFDTATLLALLRWMTSARADGFFFGEERPA